MVADGAVPRQVAHGAGASGRRVRDLMTTLPDRPGTALLVVDGLPRVVAGAHTDLCWSGHRAPGRTAGTVLAAELDLSATTGRQQ